jgi:hypothetical protein
VLRSSIYELEISGIYVTPPRATVPVRQYDTAPPRSAPIPAPRIDEVVRPQQAMEQMKISKALPELAERVSQASQDGLKETVPINLMKGRERFRIEDYLKGMNVTLSLADLLD